MATTYIPPMGVLKKDFDAQQLLEWVHELLESAKGDEDKSDEVENNFYYEGLAAAYAHVEQMMTGTNPLAQ